MPNYEWLLRELGGVASRAVLIKLTSRRDFDRAVSEGALVRIGYGRYALPDVEEAPRAAAALGGIVSHLSAAQHYGWELKHPPSKPWVTVRHNRHLDDEQQGAVRACWSNLPAGDIHDGWITTRARTFLDVARQRPFDEGLSMADSALRRGDLTRAALLRLAEAARGPGSQKVKRVAREATGKAANLFESVLRSIALDVPGLAVRPQVRVVDRPPITPDLVDERLRLAIEAESFAWHGDRQALWRDCRRYTLLAMHGWRVVRFSWHDVMREPDYVRSALTVLARGDVAEEALREVRVPPAA